MERIGKKEFTVATFILDNETFVVCIALLITSNLNPEIYPF